MNHRVRVILVGAVALILPSGRWRRITVTIERAGDGLGVRLGAAARATPLRHLGDDVFVVINAFGQPGAVCFMFVRDPAGGPPALHFDQDNAHHRLERSR